MTPQYEPYQPTTEKLQNGINVYFNFVVEQPGPADNLII